MFEPAEKIAVGDRVMLLDRKFTGETEEIAAQVLEVREILGKETYVVETERGARKVVGASQVSRASA
jgi:hypothetical protein